VSGPTILLTGARGFLGRQLCLELERRRVTVRTAGRRDCDVWLDLEEASSISRAVAAVRPEVVLHAAAIASVGACEADPARAERVNARATELLAEASRGRLLLVSTDLVFDGAAAPYASDAAAEPRCVYGRVKLAAERSALAAGGSVARLPLLFGRSFDGRRGATDMIRSARRPLRLFTNEYRTPLHVDDAARGLAELVLDRSRGRVLQLAGPERVSRYELGRRLLRAARIDVAIEPAESSDPKRPRDVSLVSDRDCGRSLDAALAGS
jgi:dTDP-4-dehydrorhamnose reductase